MKQISKLQGWSKRNKFNLQLSALGLALLAPFGLYGALSAGLIWVAVICFALFALGMTLTFLAG